MSKELKLLMTKVAKGEITEKEAQKVIKSKKVDENKPKRQKNTLKRKDQTKCHREVK